MNYEIMRGYSILGSADYSGMIPVQSAIVTIKTYPYSRVFLGCALGAEEDELYQRVAGMGDELSFEFIEKLYNKMKEERGRNE
jgi:hypothetical protein